MINIEVRTCLLCLRPCSPVLLALYLPHVAMPMEDVPKSRGDWDLRASVDLIVWQERGISMTMKELRMPLEFPRLQSRASSITPQL